MPEPINIADRERPQPSPGPNRAQRRGNRTGVITGANAGRLRNSRGFTGPGRRSSQNRGTGRGRNRSQQGAGRVRG